MSEASSKELAKTWRYTRYEEFENKLQTAAAKWFQNRGYRHQEGKDYILAEHGMWLKNIICSDVRDYIYEERKNRCKKSPFILHKYAHHGLSSQAMVFNLLGPLIVRKDFAPLQSTLANIGIDWSGEVFDARFEYEKREVFNEDVGQPTSIDVFLAGKDNCLFIEAKLSEQEFGGCSIFAGGDCEGRNPYPDKLGSCYLHHIGRKYWSELKKYDFSHASLLNGAICPFANYYQFFREVLFALCNDGTFILLHDERNPAFLRRSATGEPEGGLWPFLYEAIPHSLRHRVGRLTIQSLVEEIKNSGRHDDWIYEFKAKYGME